MAEEIVDIHEEIISQVQADATLGPLLTNTSRTARWRLKSFIVAVAIWTQQKLNDLFKQEVEETIAAMKPHSLRWYAEKAEAFRYGQNLIDDSDQYSDAGLTEAQIEASQIIAYAAVVELDRGLRVKVAKDGGTDLVPLSAPELASFQTYMGLVKDAGVKLTITSTAADDLKLTLRVKYNALVLNELGERIDGTSNTPVPDAIREHLKNLPFNGVFSIAKLVDAIQAVEGVTDVAVDVCQTKYGALAFTSVNIDYTPDSGYLRIDDADLSITFIAA